MLHKYQTEKELEKGEASPAKLVDYTPVSQTLFRARNLISSPYIATYQFADKQLCYLAASHANSATHPTCLKIKTLINDFQPDCLILEGFENTPKTIQSLKNEAEKLNWEEMHDEVIYAIKIANEKNIPFISGEPNNDIIELSLKSNANGYVDADLYYQGFFANIHEIYRTGKHFNTIEAYLKDYLGDHFTANSVINYNDWCDWRLNRRPSIKELQDSNFTGPIKDGHFVQRLTRAKGDLRNHSILQRIDEQLAENKKVLVIYGSSHHFEQNEILEQKYGAPTYERLDLQSFAHRCVIS